LEELFAQFLSPYNGYDKSRTGTNCNCAGLAHRTYNYIGKIEDVKKLLEKGRKIDCKDKCKPLEIKHWLWEFDMHVEDVNGNKLADLPRDFHTVAGQSDKDGNDPKNVYSKDGKRPVKGPGTGASFKPLDREQVTTNSPAETPVVDGQGRPIYWVLTNSVETCYCLPCPGK
jgi:hypothetical protein